MTKNLFLLLGFMLFSSLALSSAEEDKVKLQFVCFPQVSGENFIDLFVEKKEVVTVETPSQRFSETYVVNRQPLWKLGKQMVSEDGEPFFKTFCSVPSIKSDHQLILLVRKGTKQEDGFATRVINKKIASFKGGDYYVVNLTKAKTFLRIGAKSKYLSLSPNQSKKISAKPDRKMRGGREILFAKIGYLKGDKPILLYDSTWRYRKLVRSMLFIYQDPVNKQIKRHSISEYL